MSQSNDTLIEIVELHANEVQMLRDMRTRFRFGEVTIIMRDGLPVRWKRITEFGEPEPIEKVSKITKTRVDIRQ